jgi:hypothetical protein
MKYINLTPHEIVIKVSDDDTRVIPPSGIVARCKENTRVFAVHDGITIVKKEYPEASMLPEEEENTFFIVSILVAQLYRGERDDLLYPDTGPEGCIRDCHGQIVGVRRLAMF